MKKQNLVTTLSCKGKKSAHIVNLCAADFLVSRLDLFRAFAFSRIVIFR